MEEPQSQVISQRKEKAESLREQGVSLYPNHFRPTARAADVRARFDGLAADELEKIEETFGLAGRIMARRDYGKSVFFRRQRRQRRHSGVLT